ncbi:hypothetical protein OH77DRAFT_1140057 [Trametes cingulata]|nr:hypothetical protein OH77DRAFT_1140057 [Trametes cingulata]
MNPALARCAPGWRPLTTVPFRGAAMGWKGFSRPGRRTAGQSCTPHCARGKTADAAACRAPPYIKHDFPLRRSRRARLGRRCSRTVRWPAPPCEGSSEVCPLLGAPHTISLVDAAASHGDPVRASFGGERQQLGASGAARLLHGPDDEDDGGSRTSKKRKLRTAPRSILRRPQYPV